MVLNSLNFLVPPVFFVSSLEDSPGKMHIFALTLHLVYGNKKCKRKRDPFLNNVFGYLTLKSLEGFKE